VTHAVKMTTALTAPSTAVGGTGQVAEFRRVLRKLQQRPDVLTANLAKVDRQLEDLCLKDYTVHIQNYRCIQTARQNVTSMASACETLQQVVVDLQTGSSSSTVLQHAAELAEQHKTNQETLAQHNVLLELLELPQLMDTCVRKALHSQAVQLLAFSNVLEKRHSTRLQHPQNCTDTASASCGGEHPKERTAAELSAPVVESIIDDVRRSALSLRAGLLRLLRNDVKLPQCLTVLNLLKRIDRLLQRAVYLQPPVHKAVSAFNLPREFLQHRDEWLARSLKSVGSDDAYTFLMAVVDKSRLLWFDVMTQYKAVFSAGRADRSDASTRILATWVLSRLKGLHNIVRVCLPHITDFGQLERALDQCMYLGLSLKRVGADFRSSLLPLFQKQAEMLASQRWEQVWGAPVSCSRSSVCSVNCNCHHFVNRQSTVSKTISRRRRNRAPPFTYRKNRYILSNQAMANPWSLRTGTSPETLRGSLRVHRPSRLTAQLMSFAQVSGVPAAGEPYECSVCVTE